MTFPLLEELLFGFVESFPVVATKLWRVAISHSTIPTGFPEE
jgi:hypothetical protein